MPDLSTVGGPALSATTDTPATVAASVGETTPTPAPAASPPPAELEAKDAAETETAVSTPTTTPAPKEPEAKEQSGINKRFSELTADKKEAQAKAAAAESAAAQLAADLKTAIDKLNAIGSKAEADKLESEAAADQKPERSKFDDPDGYDKALEEWGIRQGKRQAEADITKRQADEKAAAEQRSKEEKEAADRAAADEVWNQTVQTYNDRRAKAIERLPDYEKVAEGDHVMITNPMRDAILTADIGPQIAYHLGKNPEEAARIAALSPFQQVKEMGKLEATLERAAKNNTSRAPDPIKTVGSRESAGPKDLNAISGDEYYELTKNEARHQRGRH
jgi:hypothetical protein